MENHQENKTDGIYEDHGLCGGCFNFSCCFKRYRSRGGGEDGGDGEGRYLLHEKETSSSSTTSWVVERLKKVKEISELVAGPKWKTFIRKLGKKNYKNEFQYDAESYALNFDDGDGGGGGEKQQDEEEEEEDDDGFVFRFSERFALPVPHDHQDRR